MKGMENRMSWPLGIRYIAIKHVAEFTWTADRMLEISSSDFPSRTREHTLIP